MKYLREGAESIRQNVGIDDAEIGKLIFNLRCESVPVDAGKADQNGVRPCILTEYAAEGLRAHIDGTGIIMPADAADGEAVFLKIAAADGDGISCTDPQTLGSFLIHDHVRPGRNIALGPSLSGQFDVFRIQLFLSGNHGCIFLNILITVKACCLMHSDKGDAFFRQKTGKALHEAFVVRRSRSGFNVVMVDLGSGVRHHIVQ